MRILLWMGRLQCSRRATREQLESTGPYHIRANMDYRRLGKTPIQVSVMAVCTWPFGGGEYWGDQDEQASIQTAHAALDAGINFFDSAEGYEAGESERVLGKALAGRRQEAVIATKVS